MSSQNRFGYEWDTYSALTQEYNDQFRNWTGDQPPSFWKDKAVLDAGCGMGRNSYWPLTWGAASVTAFDFDERTVQRAKETLKNFKNATVEFASIFAITWENKFDVAFSIGVVHHLEDPKKALANMVRALKPGGVLHIWVYSYEGNEWIVRFVDPVRIHITSRLPVGLVHILSYFCSVPLFIFVHMYRGTNGYLQQLKNFKFWHLHSIVFDQLIPDIAHYWKKEEVRALVDGLPVKNVEVKAPRNGSGWILTAIKN